MSEVDNKPGADGGDQTPDPITNLKAEFSRKQSNIEAKLQESQQALQAIMAKLDGAGKPAPEPKPTKVSVFDDEEAYARSIEERVLTQVQQQNQVQTTYQTIAGQLVSQYPEINDTSSDLYKAAQEKLKGVSQADMVKNPLLMKAAVLEAAAEAGLKPRSKRSQDTDDFSLGGGGGNRRTSKPKEEVSAEVLELAALMGRDTSDPKVMARLKETSKRTNWSKYK